ncbi:U1 zinc finger-domain-containing protein [Parasitella parasitica]|nr:U1 zinc finger-domain-containing protein [Parasitella parasitica]
MPKYYCEYCDIFLTHDSSSVRKAHNAGKNHILNVRNYYAEISHDKAQSIIDEITRAYDVAEAVLPAQYAGYPQPPYGGFPPPPNGFGGRPPPPHMMARPGFPFPPPPGQFMPPPPGFRPPPGSVPSPQQQRPPPPPGMFPGGPPPPGFYPNGPPPPGGVASSAPLSAPPPPSS